MSSRLDNENNSITWLCDGRRFAVLLVGIESWHAIKILSNLLFLVLKNRHPVSFRVLLEVVIVMNSNATIPTQQGTNMLLVCEKLRESYYLVL